MLQLLHNGIELVDLFLQSSLTAISTYMTLQKQNSHPKAAILNNIWNKKIYS